MNIIFAATGKAGKNGHEQWRKVCDEDFSTRIYTHSKREASETSRLEIELRELQGERYSYYTYLIVKNVAQVKSKEDEVNGEKHGRTGSFFGMTIRIHEGYIADISRLYSLFEKVFQNRIKETILTNQNTDGYLTYLIEKFADGEEHFALAEQDLLSNISSADIRELPTNCVTQQHRNGEVKLKYFNVADTNRGAFFPALFNDAEINVSREYDTMAEIEARRIKEIEEQKKREAEKQKDNEKKPLGYLSETKVHREFLSAAKDELDKKTKEELIAIIHELRKTSGENNTSKGKIQFGHTPNMKNIILLVIVFVVIFAIVFFVGRKSYTESDPDTAHEEENVLEKITTPSNTSQTETEDKCGPKKVYATIINTYNLRAYDKPDRIVVEKANVKTNTTVELIQEMDTTMYKKSHWSIIVYGKDTVMITSDGIKKNEE